MKNSIKKIILIFCSSIVWTLLDVSPFIISKNFYVVLIGGIPMLLEKIIFLFIIIAIYNKVTGKLPTNEN
jgi:ABC-type uncharacterized transport system permease subunit